MRTRQLVVTVLLGVLLVSGLVLLVLTWDALGHVSAGTPVIFGFGLVSNAALFAWQLQQLIRSRRDGPIESEGSAPRREGDDERR